MGEYGSFQVVQLTDTFTFQQYEPGIRALLYSNLPFLHDDEDSPDVDRLLRNLKRTLPDVFIVTDKDGTVLVGGSLTDISAGQTATIHGVSLPVARKTGAIEAVTFALMERAFVDYGVTHLNAVVSQAHLGARGFCQNYRFQPVYTHPKGMLQQGNPVPVTTYQLSAKRYYQQTRRLLAHVLWKKEEEQQQRAQNYPHHQNRIQLATGRRI